MPSQIFLRSSEHLILSGPLLQHTSKAKHIIILEATFDVLSVDLLLVPFVVFLTLGLQFLNALEPQPKVRIVYVCFISSLCLVSFRRLD